MIAIIDYGMGNLRSVQKGFEKVGHQATVTSDPAVVAAAEKVVLPGVGAFEDAIAELRNRGLTKAVLAAIDAGKPFLGICLGLQLLFDVSYENGRHEGLGVLKGEIVRFELPDEYAVPHMGWNQLAIRGSSRKGDRPLDFAQRIPKEAGKELGGLSPFREDPETSRRPPILEGLAEGTFVYFVHSYYVVPQDPAVVATETDYGGPFCSMIWRDNLFATQFHPEKSQSDGLRILKNFAEL